MLTKMLSADRNTEGWMRALTGALLACLFAGAAYGADTTEPLHREKDGLNFSLAISGGISLGMYESGVNWAFIKHLRNMRDCSNRSDAGRECVDEQLSGIKTPYIRSISGASAGGVNALLSAVAWCVKDDASTRVRDNVASDINDNIFKKTWVGIGVDELLPSHKEKTGTPYSKEDLLFTRNAFNETVTRLSNMLDQDIYRGDCDVPLALTLTRIRPEKISTAGIAVNNSRFTLPVRFVSDSLHPGKIKLISNIVDPNDPYWGNIIYLPGTKTRSKTDGVEFTLRIKDVISAVLASSSYPLAFGNTNLKYCFQDKMKGTASPAQDAGGTCPDGYALREKGDDFIDGGVFDNVPLGVAKALAEPCGMQKETLRRVNYIYIDPGNMRDPDGRKPTIVSDASGTEQAEISGGSRGNLLEQMKFLNGAIKTGLDYELYNVLRSGDWNHRAELIADTFIDALKVPREKIDPFRCGLVPPDCTALFRNLPKDLTDENYRDLRLHAAVCLRNRSYDLENAFKIRKSGTAETEAIREQLIAWLHSLNDSTSRKKRDRSQMLRAIEQAAEDGGGERMVLLSSRFSRITGDYLAHFGAFLDKQFRNYDYYTGVYDAVYGIVNFRCQGNCSPDCLGSQTRNLYRELNVGVDPSAAHVFLSLAEREHRDEIGAPGGPWSWVADEHAANGPHYLAGISRKKDPMEALLLAIENKGKDAGKKGPMDTLLLALENKGTDPEKKDGFVNFLRILKEQGYPPDPTLNEMLKRVDKSAMSMFYPLTAQASVRLKDIVADGNGEADGDQLSTGTRAALLALNTRIDDEQRFEFARSTVPPKQAWGWYILPNELSADVVNGGAFFSWEPRWNRNNSTSVNFKITPYVQDTDGNDTFRMSQLDVYYTRKRKDETISSWGIGPSVYQAWHSYQKSTSLHDHYGISAFVGAIGDKFRLTVGLRNVHASDYPAASNNFYILLGVTDIPGMSYWFFSK
jgi:predicted acylesterase/phospholipase RssA